MADASQRESPQVSTRRVVIIVISMMLVLVLIAFGFQLPFRDRIGQTFVVRHQFPEPAVAPDERTERQTLEAQQRRDLNGAHGRIPIETAMQAVAAKGAHAFDPVRSGP